MSIGRFLSTFFRALLLKVEICTKVGFAVLVGIAGVLAGSGVAGAASTFTALYDFPSSANGANPDSSVAFDSSGNLFGTATSGGSSGQGVVFELSPTKAPPWKQTVLYSFTGGSDGSHPFGSGVIFDAAGNLYGTTYFDNGTVFKLSKDKSGKWIKTTLWIFGGAGDGASPSGGLIFDRAGNLYGTTVGGGASNGGAVFMLTPSGKETVLYSFCAQGGSKCTDGLGPFDSGVIFDSSGNLYGTTRAGGNANCTQGCGVVFKLTRPTSVGGAWTESVLYSFTNGANDGSSPQAGLIFDRSGNLYGTTDGSSSCCGTVFELTPSGGPVWNETLLYRFAGSLTDGSIPSSPLVMDASGSLFGTTMQGGPPACNCGILFKLTPTATPPWAESVLYQFTGDVTDGGSPWAGLIFDASGALYGTAGGANGSGAVFELSGAAYGLKVAVAGAGAVRSAPSGIACTGTCNAIFDPWTVVALTAKPANGSIFVGWGGACRGAQTTCTVPMYVAQSVTAKFISDTLSVSISSGGVVTSSPAGINCPGTCSANYTPGTPGTLVTLTATAKTGDVFTGWGGACSGVDICTVTMNANKSVTAGFSAAPSHSLSLFLGGNGVGTVASQPSGINCTGPCSASFASGTQVTLTAAPTSGSTFDGWSGACSGAVSTCEVTMNEGRNVTAGFSQANYALSVSVVGSGTVASQPSGVSCPGACSVPFTSGTRVSLTTTPESGFVFQCWSGNGACWGMGPCELTLYSNQSVTATFAPVPPRSASIHPAGASASAATALP